MQKILFRDTRHQNLPDVFAPWNVTATAATKFGDDSTKTEIQMYIIRNADFMLQVRVSTETINVD